MNNCTKRIQFLAIILIAALAMLWTVIPAKAATAEGFSFGSKNVILSEGTYTVPLRLKNASNLLQQVVQENTVSLQFLNQEKHHLQWNAGK